jgi:hypothetical protein
LNLSGRDFDTLPVTDHEGLRGGQIEQGADGIVGPTTGAHLEPVAEQNEGGQHGRGLVKDLSPTRHRHGERVEPARSDRDCDQHHHVQSPCAKRANGAGEEDRARVEDHRQAEDQREHVLAQAERSCGVEAENIAPDR